MQSYLMGIIWRCGAYNIQEDFIIMEKMVSMIERVTVFLQGAEITRKAAVKLEKGENKIVLGGLPGAILPQSLSAAVEGAGLLRVNYRQNYLQPAQGVPALEALRKKLEDCEDRQRKNENALTVQEAALAFLQSNQCVVGEKGISVGELEAMAKYQQTGAEEILEKKRVLLKEAEKLEEEHAALLTVVEGYRNEPARPTGEVELVLQAEAAGEAQIGLSYFVQDAGWTVKYELRVKDVSSPAVLLCKGDVVQTTGEDWENVGLKLSTGAPSMGGPHPKVAPWYVDLWQPEKVNRRMAKQAEMEYAVDKEMAEPVKMMADMSFASVEHTATSIEYALPMAESVPSQGDAHTVELFQREMEAKYYYYTAPKLDLAVYLVAAVKGWENLDILEGEASIMLGNTFVGTAYITTEAGEDEMEVTLGKDSGILVSREKDRDFAAKAMLGTSRKDTRQWTIAVRNTKATPVHIEVVDQVPVSVNKELVVEPVEVSGGAFEKDTGLLKWEADIEAGGAKEWKVEYVASYPNGRRVELD